MSISFIITTFNIAPYILQCLESLKPCLMPGDQVILVDDGSTDGTDDVVRAFIAQEGLGPDVLWTPVWLGVNTIGGVGIAGNIGLDHVLRDTVFFVDGDDYLIPQEFLLARLEYERAPSDIHFTDYLEFDQQKQETKRPADHHKWDRLVTSTASEQRLLAAVDMIAVPWRKFYSTAFLRQNNIRYPEGDFFFEDNPFHWRVCMAARSIGASHRVTCHHRINRPGQTMASTGGELAAFFTHFQTILSDIPAPRADLRVQAGKWLLNNMSWHLQRLMPSAFTGYATQAHKALALIADTDWNGPLAAAMSKTEIWRYAGELRRGGTWAVVEAWHGNADRQMLRRLSTDIAAMNEQLLDLKNQMSEVRNLAKAQRVIAEFDAITAMMNTNATSS